MRCLGLDLGSKTLGIAISDATNLVASVYKTLHFEEDNYESLLSPLKEIITKEEIGLIVLGLPKNMDNSLGKRAEITLAFKDRLVESLNIPIVMEDERLTSVISNNVLISANVSRKKRKQKVDGMAAVLILQGYLDKLERGICNEWETKIYN